MFLPSPKSDGFVLNSSMTNCTKASAQAGRCMHSWRYLSNKTVRDSNIMQKLYMCFSFSLF